MTKRKVNPKLTEFVINKHLDNIEKEMKEIRKALKSMYYFEKD